MSECKFACPVCGQHITCDSAVCGTPMECPTCFRKIVVPRAPTDSGSKFVLTATEAGQRSKSSIHAGEPQSPPASKNFPVAAVALVVLLFVLAAGAVMLRDKIFKTGEATVAGELPNASGSPKYWNQPAPDTNWTLNLAEREIPDAPATGRINGRSFALSRATVQGGTLSFRQGAKWPPELGVTIQLFVKQSEDLAGQTVRIEATNTNAAKLTLRWKDEHDKAVNRTVRAGYALRMQFGAVRGGRLPGNIYLCVPDEAQTWMAGTFEAEIRKTEPAKGPKAPKPPITRN